MLVSSIEVFYPFDHSCHFLKLIPLSLFCYKMDQSSQSFIFLMGFLEKVLCSSALSVALPVERLQSYMKGEVARV